MQRLIFLSLIIVFLFNFSSIVHCAPEPDPYRTCACGELGFYPKIVGGREARPHQYPWQAALFGFPELDNYFCGATIISSRFLITAGHCFYDKDKKWDYNKIHVKVGVHNLTDKDALTIKAKSFKRYEGYTEENDIEAPLLDIALIELEDDLPVNDKIRPICVHSKYFNYQINELKANRFYKLNRLKRNVFGSVRDFFTEQYDHLFGSTSSNDDVIDNPDDHKDHSNDLNDQPRPTKSKTTKQQNEEQQFINQPTDKHQIILDHPDKNLIKQVVDSVFSYYQQIKNDQEKVFDPAKEFTTDKLTVVGWGSIDRYDLSILPDVLMETQIHQKRSEICENAYGDDVFFRSKMICANDENTDSCNGDSGGGLATKTYGRMNLYGVVSYGRACGSFSSPGVYTRISAFLEWILLHSIESKFCPN